MQISDLISNPRLTVEMARNKVLQDLRAGQILHARVLTPSAHNRVKLQIGAAEIFARTRTSLTQGQRIILDVVKTGPLPELRLLQQNSMRETHASALRTILPRQIPLQNMFQNLQQVHSAITRYTIASTGDNSALPSRPMVAIAREKAGGEALQLLRNMADAGSIQKNADRLGPELLNRVTAVLESSTTGNKRLSPAIVRQLFLDSGIFLEPKLAAGQPPGNDLKATLLLLLLQLRTAMTQQQRPAPQGGEQQGQPQQPPADSAINKLLNLLLRQTEGGLARIQLNQLNSVPTEDSSKVVWQFELPLRHADEFDSFKVRIERDDSNNEIAQHRWRITINFDLDPIGPVQAQISLQGEEVSTLFIAELNESAELIDRNLPILDQAFSQAGLKVGHLAAQKTGRVAMDEPQLSPHPLLDEQA
jgi:hypothetical protein